MIRDVKFSRWHEQQLYRSFVWLISCLMCGFLFVALVELITIHLSGIYSIIALIVLYAVGLAIIELFRRFWMLFSFAQECASSATCSGCGRYGLFQVRVDTVPIYARCQHCDHQWVIGQKDR